MPRIVVPVLVKMPVVAAGKYFGRPCRRNNITAGENTGRYDPRSGQPFFADGHFQNKDFQEEDVSNLVDPEREPDFPGEKPDILDDWGATRDMSACPAWQQFNGTYYDLRVDEPQFIENHIKVGSKSLKSSSHACIPSALSFLKLCIPV